MILLRSKFRRPHVSATSTDSIRILLDTNVFMAARWKKGGYGFRIVEAGADGKLPLVWCPELKEEAFRILGRIKTERDFIDGVGRCFPKKCRVESGPRKSFGAGRVDDILIGCCLFNRVDVLISSDKKLSVVAEREGLSVLNPAQFCERYPVFFSSGRAEDPAHSHRNAAIRKMVKIFFRAFSARGRGPVGGRD